MVRLRPKKRPPIWLFHGWELPLMSAMSIAAHSKPSLPFIPGDISLPFLVMSFKLQLKFKTFLPCLSISTTICIEKGFKLSITNQSVMCFSFCSVSCCSILLHQVWIFVIIYNIQMKKNSFTIILFVLNLVLLIGWRRRWRRWVYLHSFQCKLQFGMRQ